MEERKFSEQELVRREKMQELIDKGIEAGNMSNVTKYGTFMFVIAIGTLSLGFLAGNHAAKASTGFAANLRCKIASKSLLSMISRL